jgi:uracil phosphoribosyltransferase
MSSSDITANNVHVLQHPLVRSKLTTLRLHDLPPKDFREVGPRDSDVDIYPADDFLSTLIRRESAASGLF